MSVLRELAMKLGLEVDEASFTAGVLAAKAIEKGFEAIVDVAKDVAKEFVEVVKESVELTERIELTSQSLGLTTDALQELTYAGSLTGIQMDEMGLSIGLLSRNMNAAAKGGDEQAKVFAKLGIKVKDSNGHLRAADEVMADVADKFQKMPDGAEKTALSIELFGRSGKRMIPLLNKGSEGLAEMRQEAHELGVVLDEDIIKQGVEVEHNFKRLEALWEGIKAKAAASLFPALKHLTDAAVTWVRANKVLIAQKLTTVFQAIAWAGRRLLDVVDVLRGSFALLRDIVVSVVQAGFQTLMNIMHALGPTITAAAAAFLTGWLAATFPITALAVALGGVMLLLNSIQRWREGKDSLFGDWMKQLDEWRKARADDPWFIVDIKRLIDYIETAIKRVQDLFDALQKSPNLKTSASAINNFAANTGEATANTIIPKFGFAKRFDARAEAAKAQGGSYWEQVKAGFGFGTPMLPPGQGVLAGGGGGNVYSPTYQIYQAPGMSPQDVVTAIQDHHEGMLEDANAALGP